MNICKKLLAVVLVAVVLIIFCGAVTATAEFSSSLSEGSKELVCNWNDYRVDLIFNHDSKGGSDYTVTLNEMESPVKSNQYMDYDSYSKEHPSVNCEIILYDGSSTKQPVAAFELIHLLSDYSDNTLQFHIRKKPCPHDPGEQISNDAEDNVTGCIIFDSTTVQVGSESPDGLIKVYLEEGVDSILEVYDNSNENLLFSINIINNLIFTGNDIWSSETVPEENSENSVADKSVPEEETEDNLKDTPKEKEYAEEYAEEETETEKVTESSDTDKSVNEEEAEDNEVTKENSGNPADDNHDTEEITESPGTDKSVNEEETEDNKVSDSGLSESLPSSNEDPGDGFQIDKNEVNLVSESENSSGDEDEVDESQNYPIIGDSYDNNYDNSTTYPSYTETICDTFSEYEYTSSVFKVIDESITSEETPHVTSYSITNSSVDLSHLGSNGTKVDISVLSDEKIRSIMFCKEGTDEYSATLGGIMPLEDDGVYSLEFVSEDNTDTVGMWYVYATFDSGSDEMIGTINVIQSEPVNSSDAEIKENALSEELGDSKKAVPASPGFGIPVCLGVFSMLLIPVLRRR